MKDALRARATVGEVCDALREVWGAYVPDGRVLTRARGMPPRRPAVRDADHLDATCRTRVRHSVSC